MDYVYKESVTEELKSVHVELYPNSSGEYFDLKFTSSGIISTGDLEDILNSLWTEWFSRLRINPVDDCKIILIAAGVEYEVAVAPLPRIFIEQLNPKRD